VLDSRKHPNRAASGVRSALASLVLGLMAVGLIGCPSTMFFDEGQGQPSDRALGKAPPGSIGACREPMSKRPPLINEALWDNLRDCNKRTPRRFLRLGYSKAYLAQDDAEAVRVKRLMQELAPATQEQDGNVRMIQLLRAVRQEARGDPKLEARVERASGRTFACDYSNLPTTTEKEFANVQEDSCPAYAYDPKLRRNVCMFDTSIREARWLTSGWACLAFTDTMGEGESCHRLCAYDDYCAGQISCSQPDFDLVMCALGVCMPEKIAALY